MSSPITVAVEGNRFFPGSRRPVEHWLFDGRLRSARSATQTSCAGRCWIATDSKLQAWRKGTNRKDELPSLAVKVVTKQDRVGDIHDIIDDCFDSGICAVWILDPHWKTLQVFRKNQGQ